MLKRLGLLLPSLRRIHDERNKYAALVEALTKEISLLHNYNDHLKSENESLQSGSMTSCAGLIKEIHSDLQMLKNEVNNAGVQVRKIENDVQFCLGDIRREFFSFAYSKVATQHAYQIKTEHPIAIKSDDHIYPRGTRNDNTRYPRFVYAAERAIGKKLKVMELGCAGGGLVLDFILAGHDAVGIEGSDYSAVWRRAEWGTIPDRLFTADITKPFYIFVDGVPQKFDLITAWEVLEHIRDDDLDGLFDNIRRYLDQDGVFCGSVATFEDRDPISGAVWHVTVKSYDWWVRRITDAGFEIIEGLFSTADFPRGSGNPRAMWDWDAASAPEMGFHICFRLKQERSLK